MPERNEDLNMWIEAEFDKFAAEEHAKEQRAAALRAAEKAVVEAAIKLRPLEGDEALDALVELDRTVDALLALEAKGREKP
jgi:hypothetical protein